MKNKFSLLAFIVIGFITVIGCSRFTQQGNVTSEGPGTNPPPATGDTFSLAGKEWKSFELEDQDIKVDLPGEPQDKTPPTSALPAGWDQVFSSMKIHSYDEKDFGSSYSQLVPTGKRSFTINELADTSMAALRKQARDLSYNLDIKSPTNAKYNGTFSRNGKNYLLKGCCIYQKSPARVWAVITVFPKDNQDGQVASEKIIDSVSFRGSSEACR